MMHIKKFEAFSGSKYSEYFIDLIDDGYAVIYNSNNMMHMNKVLNDKDLIHFDSGYRETTAIIKVDEEFGLPKDKFYQPISDMLVDPIKRLLVIEGFERAIITLKVVGVYDPVTLDRINKMLIEIALD